MTTWDDLELHEVDEAPISMLRIEYQGGVEIKTLGQELTPTQVKDRPLKMSWDACDKSKLYTVILTDPDAPSQEPPKFREWQHYVAINVHCCDISTGDVMSGYIGSGPPKGTGLHRYVWLVYEQPGQISPPEDLPRLLSTSSKGRAKFSARTLRKKLGLERPMVATCYQAKWDNYVPTLYEQLKD
uniref:Phosphatidylethanolamine binding protein 1 n=1 Tax=Eptatretus burgeri TaxID=7764 RepID=A0A8C4N1I8_EPTBU